MSRGMMCAVNAELLNVMVPELKLLLPELDEKGRRLAMGAVRGPRARAGSAPWRG